MRIHIQQIPYTVAEFHVKLSNYLLARVAHRLTEGVPAPFPDDEIFRVFAERIEAGEPIEIYDDREPVPAAVSMEEMIAADIARDTAIKTAATGAQKSVIARVLDFIA